MMTCELVCGVPGVPEVLEEDLLEHHLAAEPSTELRLGGERQLGVQESGQIKCTGRGIC